MLDRRRFLDWGRRPADGLVCPQGDRIFPKHRRTVDLAAARKPEETLYVYVQDWNDYEANDYEASGACRSARTSPSRLLPPTWREYLRSLGHRLDTSDDIARVCASTDLDAGRTRQL